MSRDRCLVSLAIKTSYRKRGASLIQWSVPTFWAQDFLDHYLASLGCFLGPVEELEERVQTKLASIAFLEEQLRKLESLDWIVVHEDEIPPEQGMARRSKSNLDLHSTILFQEDYLSIASQFQLKDMIHSLVRHSLGQGALSHSQEVLHSLSDSESEQFLKLFSVCHHLSLILIRGIHVVPASFSTFLQYLANTIVFLSDTLCQEISSSLGADSSLHTTHISWQGHHTTVQVEVDGFVSRVFEHMIKIIGRPVWKAISYLPFSFLSADAKIHVAEVMGDFVNNSFDRLVTSEQGFALDTLVNLLSCQPMRMDFAAASIQELSWESIASELLKCLFTQTFLNRQLDLETRERGLLNMVRICTNQPELISLLILWTRDEFQMLEFPSIFDLFSRLPLSTFATKMPDLALLQGMLRDPDGSPKVRLAMYILERLNWGHRQDGSGSLFLPRHMHRSMAMVLANLYLDRMQQPREDSVVASVTSAVAQMALDKLGLATIDEYKFDTWIWYLLHFDLHFSRKFILGLKLYQKPSSADIYAVDSFSTLGKPFILLDSATFSTLRSAMKTDPLSAYLVMVVSDVGHQYHLFERHAGDLVAVVAQSGKWEAVMQILCHVFPTFQSSLAIPQEPRFLKIFQGLFAARAEPDMDGARKRFDEYTATLASGSAVKEEIIFFVKLWHAIVFGLPQQGWLATRILDRVSKISFIAGCQMECQESLKEILRQQLDVYHQDLDNFKVTMTRPLDSIYHIAAQMTRTYPELITNSSIYPKGFRAWFVFDALFAETNLEYDARKQIISRLASSAPLNKALSGVSKPLTSFSIFKWGQELTRLPPSHALGPLYVQVFASLFFEKLTPSSGSFGHLFLSDQKEILQNVLDYLQSSQRQVEEDLMFAPTEDDVNRLKRARTLLNAAHLWFTDASLIKGNIFLPSIAEEFAPVYLEMCLNGDVLAGRNAWTDLLLSNSTIISSLQEDSTAKSRAYHTDISSSNKGDIEQALSPLKPAPAFTFRTPLLERLEDIDKKLFSQTCSSVLDLFQDKSRSYQATLLELQELDLDYLQNLKILYTSSTVRNRSQKACSKKCSTPALFDYVTNKIMAVSEVKLFLSDNRVRADSVLDNDYADAKLCLSGLKVLNVLHWIKVAGEVAEREAKDVFFRLLQEAQPSVLVFPPSKYISREILDTLGTLVIQGSPDETLRLWSLLQNQVQVSLAGHIFKPSAAPDIFQDLYEQLFSRHSHLGDSATSILVRQFNVQDWVASLEDREKAKQFLMTVINVPKLEEPYHETFASNRQILHAIFKIKTCKMLIIEASQICFANEISGRGHYEILQEAISALFSGHLEDLNLILESLVLVECQFSRVEMLNLAGSISDSLKRRIEIHCQSPLHIDSRSISCIDQLLGLLFSCQPVYAMMTDLHFQELTRLLRDIFLSWMGIVRTETSTWKCAQPWDKAEDATNAELILSLFVKLVQKICRNAARNTRVPHILWDTLIIVIESNPPLYCVESLLEKLLDAYLWKPFLLSYEVTEKWAEWRIKGIWSDPLSHLFFMILDTCELTIFSEEDQLKSHVQYALPNQSVIHFLQLALDILVRLQTLYPDKQARLRIMNLIVNRLFSREWSRLLALDDFAYLISVLPSEWPDPVIGLTCWQSDGESLVFFLDFIRHLGDLTLRGSFEHFNAYHGYIIRLLHTQVGDAPMKPFSREHLGTVLQEHLMYAEDLKTRQQFNQPMRDLGLKDCISLLNHIDKGHPCYLYIWEGLLASVSASHLPLQYLECSCITFSSSNNLIGTNIRDS